MAASINQLLIVVVVIVGLSQQIYLGGDPNGECLYLCYDDECEAMLVAYEIDGGCYVRLEGGDYTSAKLQKFNVSGDYQDGEALVIFGDYEGEFEVTIQKIINRTEQDKEKRENRTEAFRNRKSHRKSGIVETLKRKAVQHKRRHATPDEIKQSFRKGLSDWRKIKRGAKMLKNEMNAEDFHAEAESVDVDPCPIL
ncbi:uncharacterized protein [Atheta coriaria]|uniref:uncharacterized protein n=1 Tax=Dalotia coriaria TaxID=877792 RepID=UPI0031F43445